MKRFVSLVILIVGLLLAGFPGTAMAQGPSPQSGNATVTVDVPEYIEIVGLNDFSLTVTTIPGIATNSGSPAAFDVVSNVAAIVTNGITAFSPALEDNTPTVVVSPTVIPVGTTTNCTVTLSVNIAIADAVGVHTATLTITVTKS